jgi:methyl-accepting chemotaxis protein
MTLALVILAIGAEAMFWSNMAMWIVGLAVTSIMALSLFRMKEKSEQATTERDELRADIKKAKDEKHEMVNNLVDERLRRQTHDSANAVQAFVLRLDLMNESLGKTVAEIKTQAERVHKQETDSLTALGELKQWMLKEFAGKTEYREMDEQVRKLRENSAATTEQIHSLSTQVATLAEKVNSANGK